MSPTKPVPGEPFTLPHWRAWTRRLTLDNGKPWITELFQDRFVADVFAGIRECWLIVPEENAKTTLVSGLSLYHIEFRKWAGVPVAASSRDQAEILYQCAAGFVRRSDLEGTFKCLDGFRRIRCDASGSRIQIFAADQRTGDGIIPTLCVLDELHRHRDLNLYRTWTGKLRKRGAQLIAISTAGEPGSEFEKVREQIRQMATQTKRTPTYVRAVGEQIVLHEYAVPENGDVEDLKLVKRANPLKAITVSTLREKRSSPTMTDAHWRRFTCNLPTRGESAAIAEAEWFGAQVKDEIPVGEPIWLGLDVAWKWDTTAAVPLWIRDPEYRLLGPSKVLVPPRDGTSLDPNEVEAALLEIHQRNPVHTVVMDETRAEQLGEWIQAELGATVVAWGQTNQFAAMDYEKFMEALREGWLKHTGDSALTRHVLNAIARVLPNGGARFDRPTQVRRGGDQDMRVIDALSAAAMVHTAAAVEIGVEREPMIAWA